MSKAFSNLKTYLWPICTGLLAAALIILWIGKNNEANLSSLQSPAAGEPLPGALSYSQAVEKAAPAVVNIYTIKTVIRQTHPLFSDPFARKLFDIKGIPKEQKQTGLGSGVIMNEAGYILTNNHLIQGADEILVELTDKRAAQASVVGVDVETDLAVLKIELAQLPFINSASSENIKVGDISLAIGNPKGVGQTVTMGIISAVERDNLGLGCASPYEYFIQTDAAINKGNSGGALIDAYGNLIGINTLIYENANGLGFAIPADLANKVLISIIKHGRVIRGLLGANFLELSPELANILDTNRNQGVVIFDVRKNGPAGKAGIMRGDLIIKINHHDITDKHSALGAIAEIPPGDIALIKLVRKGKEMAIKVTVAERPNLKKIDC